MPSWLSTVDIPLFISHRRLLRYRTLPKAKGPWYLDSGGFSELSLYGKWHTTPEDYVRAVRRYRDEIGNLQWAAPQDYMCEAIMLAKTGLSVREHQARTVDSVQLLRAAAPDLQFIPVLQGWKLADYLYCIKLYERAGIDLTAEPIIGVGSVCRRQSTAEIGDIFQQLAGLGIRCHGFGVKSDGLRLYGKYLASADSMAWSMRGRHVQPCAHPHPGRRVACSESNCISFALEWREKVLASLNA